MPIRRRAGGGLPIARNLIWSIVTAATLGLPPAFMIGKAAQIGLLYTFSESEVWGAEREAENVWRVSPTKTWLLTDDASSPSETPGTDFVYTHNPWLLPRLGPLLLLSLGVRSLVVQNLLICLTLYGIYVWCIGRILDLKSPRALGFLLILHLDYFGFLRPAFNLGRAWHFPLFFFCLLSILGQSKHAFFRTFSAFFLLWQYEILFGVFATAACAAVWAIQACQARTRPLGWRRSGMGAILGTSCSVALFLGQLLLYYGPERLWDDFQSTLQTRNSHNIARHSPRFSTVVEYYSHRHREWRLPGNSAELARHAAAVLVAHYRMPLVLVGLVGFASALFFLGRSGNADHSAIDGTARTLSALLVGSVVGFGACASLLRGQTYMIALIHYHPLLVFLFAPAVLLGTRTIVRCLACAAHALRPSFFLLPLCYGVAPIVFALLLHRSDAMYRLYPPLDGRLYLELTKPEFQGKQILYVTGWGDLGERSRLVVENCTGVHPQCCHNLESVLADTSGSEYVLYLRHWFWETESFVSCAEFERILTVRGHTLIASGEHYVLMKLNGPIGATCSDFPEPMVELEQYRSRAPSALVALRCPDVRP